MFTGMLFGYSILTVFVVVFVVNGVDCIVAPEWPFLMAERHSSAGDWFPKASDDDLPTDHAAAFSFGTAWKSVDKSLLFSANNNTEIVY